MARRSWETTAELFWQASCPPRLNPEPNQHEIKAIARSLIQPAWGLRRGPSPYGDHLVVRVALANPPLVNDPAWAEVTARFAELTGGALEQA